MFDDRSESSLTWLIIDAAIVILCWIIAAFLLSSCAFYTYGKQDSGTLHLESPRNAAHDIREAQDHVLYPKLHKNGFFFFWKGKL